jgi:hypothetical protein
MQLSAASCHLFFLGPNILLNTLFSDTLNLCSPQMISPLKEFRPKFHIHSFFPPPPPMRATSPHFRKIYYLPAIHTFTLSSFKIRFDDVLVSTPKSPKWSVPLRISYQNFICESYAPAPMLATFPSLSSPVNQLSRSCRLKMNHKHGVKT